MSKPRPRRHNLGSLRRLLPALRPYRGRAVAAGACLLIAASLVLLLGQGVRQLIDRGVAGHGGGGLTAPALLRRAVVAGLAVATAGRFYLVAWLGERVAGDLRRRAFSHVLSLSPAYFETARTGDILSRLSADVAVLQALIGASLSQWLRNILLLGGAGAMLVATSWRLAAIVASVVPVVVIPLVLFGRRERRLSRIAQERIADLAARAEETLNALRTVQAFTHEAADRAAFADGVERSVAAAQDRIRARASLILVVILLGFGAITFALWVGGRDVVAGRMSGGALSAFVFYAVLLATAGATLGELWGDVQRAAGAAERIFDLLDERPTITAPAAPRRLPSPPRGPVSLSRVTFRYPARPDHASLDGFSLDVAAGETVALVGPSGAGKTTVFQLLLRFHDPQSGAVRLDGIDVASLDPIALRQRIGLVSQDPVIFGASVADNIRYGRPDASDGELRDAAEAANLDFVAQLPDGFDTFLGEKGIRLSGGQRQRLAIARAILRDPPILLLDEATSALDAASERLVQQALATVARGRTTIVIAHRLATVRSADRIVVMDEGRVVATGTHAALIAEGGLYASLAALQFGVAA